MKALDNLTKALLIVGGVNWGLVGIAHFDLVAAIFGEGSVLARTVYIVVALCAVVQAVRLATPDRSLRPATSH